ncbi:MAG: RsmE family RNA methyltransferase [Planctomycetota bacterium]
MHRFFVGSENIGGKEAVLREQAHQIRDVLRLEAGEKIVVLDNKGAEFEVELTAVGKGEVKGRILEKREAKGEPGVKLVLYQSMLAREKFERVLQKCTEVGVSRFVPVISKRSIVRDSGGITEKKLTRWRRIIQEAAEQSHRGRIPGLSPPAAIEKAMDGIEGYGYSLIASPGAGGGSVGDCLKGYNGGEVALFVGPEGGFTKEEVKRCVEKGAKTFSLGKRVLRTETAAVVASALILYESGELEG